MNAVAEVCVAIFFILSLGLMMYALIYAYTKFSQYRKKKGGGWAAHLGRMTKTPRLLGWMIAESYIG